jgi:hypothetical protein
MGEARAPARLDPRLLRVLTAMCRQLLDTPGLPAAPQPMEQEAELRGLGHAQFEHPTQGSEPLPTPSAARG